MKIIYSLMLVALMFSLSSANAYDCERKGKQIQTIDINRACQKPESKDCKSAKSAYSEYQSFCSKPSTIKSASSAPINKSPAKTPAKKNPTPKNTAVKTPAVSETQQVNVPASNTFHCNDSANYKSGSCYCNTGETKETVSANTLNGVISKCIAKTENLINPPKSDVINQESQFACIRPFQYYVDSCDQQAETAVDKCDTESEENKSNSDFANLGDLLKGASAAAVQGKAGSGAYEACLNTALTTQAGFFATEKLNSETCEPAINQCKTSCSDVREKLVSNRDYILQNCENEAVNDYLTEYGSFDSEADKQKYIRNYHATVEPTVISEYEKMVAKLESAEDKCGVDAVSLQNKLKQASNDFNNAAKQAQVCRCQTGSTGEDCSAIQGPAQCALNPNAPGCALSTVNCNNSNSVQCQCLRNPNLAICKNGSSKVSGFVGNPFTTPTSSVDGNVAPKITGNDFDISFDDEAITAGASGTEGVAASPFGSAQASGGGGGGGGGGTAAGSGEEGAAAVDADSKLNVQLDKPKGFLGGLLNKLGFGGGNSADKKFKTDANGRKIDPTKWKPGMLRGVAGDGSEIGPKHRDIWKVMNSQYSLQEKTFINGK